MTYLRIEPVLDHTGAVQPAQVSVRLVGADQRPILAWRGTHPYTVDLRSALPAGGLLLDLVPQTDLRTATAAPTQYQVELRTATSVAIYTITLPAATAPVAFSDLIGVTDTARDAFVLDTGYWNDAYSWNDTAVWNDGTRDGAAVMASGYWNDDPTWSDDDLWEDET